MDGWADYSREQPKAQKAETWKEKLGPIDLWSGQPAQLRYWRIPIGSRGELT